MTASVVDRVAVSTRARTATWTIPWPLYVVLIASTGIVVGLIWDVSWHRTVGRDTFWTLAHVLEQMAAIIAGLSCGYLVLRTTFAGTPEEKARSVRFWRIFCGPLGAWVCIGGTLMMIASAPFDNWWHNAYGLDVKIISPPHMVLAGGMIGIQMGAMLMVLSAQNRASADDQRLYSVMHAVAAGILITMMATLVQEDASVGNQMHGTKFYEITAFVIPLFLIGLSRASRLRWPATTITAIYSAITLAMSWILQLFAATPKLAPIYNAVTHMVPPSFPLLIIVPAFAIDLLMKRFGHDNDWKLSIAIGVTWVVLMVAVHWFWADFLLSPAARNFVIGADQWSYTDRLGSWRYEYWTLDRDHAGRWSPLRFAQGISFAILLGVVSSRISLFLGKGMSKVKR